MPFSIDVRTIILALFVGNLVSALLVWSYGQSREHTASYRAFLVGKVLQALAWLLLGQRGSLPDAVTVHLANPIIFFGFGLEAFALTALYRRHVRPLFLSILAAAAAASLAYNLFQGITPNGRVALAALFSCGFYLVPGIALQQGTQISRLRRTMGLLYLLSSLALGFRATAAWLADFNFSLLTPDAVQSFSFFPTYVLMLLGSVGFLLLMKEKDDEKLQRAATRDSLTGIWNRAAFLAQAENLLALSDRQNRAASLFMMDLDRFKKLNDTFGHHTGDKVLEDFASTVSELLRRSDLFGRYGGEEFVVFLPNTGSAEARHAAERLRLAVEARRLLTENGREITYTVSIGICTSMPGAPAELGEMLRAGDQALYIAKDMGRNCVAQCGAEDIPPLDGIDMPTA
ncbi:MAG: GGDEF domain-containing protein [Desulfovibrio sp.]|nr:GGDEF domain-containing protein [Desulfovibrio sp.]